MLLLSSGSSDFILAMSSGSSEHYQGDSLWNISKRTIPKANTSDAYEYSLFYKA